MKTHPNTIANRRTHLDRIADQLAAALAPHGFDDLPRDVARNMPRCIRHQATQTGITFELSGASLGFYVAGPGATKRLTFRSIRVGYSTHGLPLTPADVEPIAFLARTLVAEFTVQDDQLRQAAA